MKYNVGDKVRIKSLDWYNKNKDNYGAIYAGNGFCFWKNMTRHCGEIMKITTVKVDPEDSNKGFYFMENSDEKWTDGMIEGLVEEETKVGTALNPIEPKSNANCLTQERVDEMSLDKAGQITDFEYEGLAYTLPEGYQFVDENGNTINATKIVLEKKKKEYPKTYEECCEALEYIPHTDNIIGYKWDILQSLQKLLICRDAYWKIAGEEMGLETPWEPDYTNTGEKKFAIWFNFGEIKTGGAFTTTQMLLSFPTAEMRDAFKENFDPDIKKCKMFL